MSDISYTDIYIAVAIVSVVIAFTFAHIFSWLSKHERKLNRFEKRDEHSVNKYDVQHVKDRCDKRIAAIEDYLGIEIVEERARPARLVAKRIGETK